mgnify:CR=1 FL=1
MDFWGPWSATISRIRVRLTGEACADLPVTPAMAMTSSEGVAAQKVAGVQWIRSEDTASSNNVLT